MRKLFRSIKINEFRQFKNQEISLGRYVTVLAGRNSTGKSTILALLANSSEIKKNVGETYTQKKFRSEFSEIIKGSKQFDQSGSNRFSIEFDGDDDNVVVCNFRTGWQKYNSEDPEPERFRVIPKWTKPDGSTSEAKLDRPVLYLGLSRLFPVGESTTVGVKRPSVKFDKEEHKDWFVLKYTEILSLNDKVETITNYSIGETDKKSGVGITTDKYDYLTNSSGQDNLGQILLGLLSFRRVKESLGINWRGGLLIIDEIDATLHPIAQNKLFDTLCKDAKENGYQVVFTTHSLSLLRHISEKTNYNTEEPNQNIELYYFTTANKKLKIKRNPSYFSVENDLMITSVVQNPHKVKVYSEDAETRWFLKMLIGDLASYVDLLDVKVGCKELLSMYKVDLEYFSKTLIILDGDVNEKTLDTVSPLIRERFGNILLLPGEGKRPEEVIYRYLLSLDSDHEFWEKADKNGFSWQYFKDHGPESSDYSQEKERERYKKWFNDHAEFLQLSHLGEYWVRDNRPEAETFIKSFRDAYNRLASRTFNPLITE